MTSSSHIDGVDEDQLGLWKHVPGWSVDGCLLLWQQYTNNMLVLDTKAQALRSVILPTGLRLVDAQSVSDTSILLRDAYGCESLLLLQQQSGDVDWRGTINAFVLPMLHTPGPGSEPMRLHLTQSNGRAPPEHLSVDPSARSAVSKSSHLMSVVGLPNRMSRGMESREGMVYTTPRERPFASANRIAAAVTSSGQLVSGLSGRDISDRRAWLSLLILCVLCVRARVAAHVSLIRSHARLLPCVYCPYFQVMLMD